MNQQTHIPADQRFPPAIVSGWTYIPHSAISDLREEMRRLTFVPKFSEDKVPVQLYQNMPSRGYLGVPRAYAQARFPWLRFEDKRSLGEPLQRSPRLPDPNHPSVKEPQRQREFMDAILAAAHKHQNFNAQAATGSGKTAVALWLSQMLGRRTMVLVHLERLAAQWHERITQLLGVDESRIGIVRGDKCDWQGKDYVIGMLPSLSQRMDYPPEFFRSIGTVLIDEAHRTGSGALHRAIPLFPAMYRFGLSATTQRKDGGDRALFWHVGPVRVVSDATAMECRVFVKRYRTKRELWGASPEKRMKCLAADPDRNAMLANIIQRLYGQGRNILVIGKFVAHLQDMMEMLETLGVPASDMGLYTGQRLIREMQSTDKGVARVVVKRVKIKDEEYKRVAEESRIIFATYGVFKEGVDIPRLDAGVDLLPQSEATQVIGRIRRPLAGKPIPWWVTTKDELCAFSGRMFESRCRDYKATGCQIIDNGRL